MGEAQTVSNKVIIQEFNLEAVQKNANLAIKEIIGVDAGINIGVKENDSSEVIEVVSRDLSEGAMPRMFETVYVVSWGSFINNNNQLFIRFHYRYKNFNGGSNGCAIATVLFNTNGTISEINNQISFAPLSYALA
jgi:hypothetical protein